MSAATPGSAASARGKAPVQTCSRCGVPKPSSREFFGSNPQGGLRLRCRECVRDYTRTYGNANKEAQAARNAKRAARGGHIRVDAATKVEMWHRQLYLCLCCGKRIKRAQDTEVDHAQPVAKGGTHVVGNLFLAHPQCNAEKHGKTLDEHWAWRKKVGLGGKRPTLPEWTV